MRLLKGEEALEGKGVVVAKASAANHDFRIDVPTVGHANARGVASS